jgi:hypothetical protein
MTPKEVIERFENLYPDEFSEERTAVMNKIAARTMKAGERYHATVIMEHTYGSLRVEAETSYAKARVYEEAREITLEETAELLARLKLKLVIRETET